MDQKKERIRYFSTSILYLVLSQIIAQLFRLIARILIARYSTSEIYGVFSVIWNEMSFVGLAALIGLGQQLTIDLPRKDDDEKKHLIHSSLFYSLILCVIIGIVALVLNLIELDNTYKYSMIISIFFILFLLNQFILIGMKDFFGVFLLFLTQNLTLLALIIILRNHLTIENIVYATAGSVAFASISILLYIFIRNKLSFRNITREKLKIFDFSMRRISFFTVDIVDSLIIYLLVKLPQIFLGASYAGFVSIAFSLMSFILVLPQIITIAMGPLISEDYKKEMYDKMHASFRTSMSLIYLFQGVIVLIFAYFGNTFIELLFGSEYISGTYFLFYGFLFAIIIDSFTYPFGLYIRNTNHENLFGIGKIISLASFVIFESILLVVMGDTFAIPIAYFISKISLLAFYFYSLIKNNEKISSKDIRKLLIWLSLIITSFIVILFVNFFLIQYTYRVLVFLSHLILLLIIIALTKVVNLKEVFQQIRSIIFPNSIK